MSQRKKALHLWSDFQRLDFSDEKVLKTMVGFA